MAASSGILDFDTKASSTIEAVYRTQDVVEQRRAVLRALDLRPGERVLDIGAGPGFLAVAMAAAVGPRGSVDGVDVSESMIALARRRSPEPHSAPLAFRLGDALALPFPDECFDVVVSTQVYEYVEDIQAALAEARRVLRPGGRLLVLDTDWDSVVWRSSDEHRMRRVMRVWDQHLVHRDLPRRLPELLREAGLTLSGCQVVPLLNVGYRRETYSAGLLELIRDFVDGRVGVEKIDVAAWASDLTALGDGYFFSSCRYLFLAQR
ncbi:MAG TPA: methyltransferase domain-containing protein [Thermoleophilaceae bacterium]|nr:methyltransferase domain-containing protein [Thermoleophilaceae bacterium]